MRWAALAGAKRIYAIDKVDSRLQLARKGAKPGIVQTIHFEQLDELDDVVEYLVAKCPEGLDVAIDCTSHDPKVRPAESAVYLALIPYTVSPFQRDQGSQARDRLFKRHQRVYQVRSQDGKVSLYQSSLYVTDCRPRIGIVSNATGAINQLNSKLCVSLLGHERLIAV